MSSTVNTCVILAILLDFGLFWKKPDCVHGWVRKIQPAAAPEFSKINSTHLHTIMKTKLILNYLL